MLIDHVLQKELTAVHFPHVMWRHIVDLTENQLKKQIPNIRLINPFGFEVLLSATSAPQKIRKMYIYASVDTEENTFGLGKLILDTALMYLEKHVPKLAHSIIAHIINNQVFLLRPQNYRCQTTDKLLDVQIRKNNKNILNDYADYLLMIHQSILSNSGEIIGWQHSKLNRSRLFQLFLMQEGIFSSYLPNTGKFQNIFKAIKPFLNNMLGFLYQEKLNNIPVSKEEMHVINTIVIPRCQQVSKLLSDSVNNDNSIAHIETTAFHVDTETILRADISKTLYNTLIEKVVHTYRYFA